MFANWPGDWGSILGQVIPKTQKMVLDAALLNTQHYKVSIKGKVEQSRVGGVEDIEKGAFRSPSTKVTSFTYIKVKIGNHIYPTPPLGQDMTQGQFLSGV